MTLERLLTLLVTSDDHRGRTSQTRLAHGLHAYLNAGCDRMGALEAAAKLGCNRKTISRYRAALRRLGGV